MPPKSNRTFPAEFDNETCKWRYLIENYFGKLKENRGIAMRSCKTDQSFKAFIPVAPKALDTSYSCHPPFSLITASKADFGDAKIIQNTFDRTPEDFGREMGIGGLFNRHILNHNTRFPHGQRIPNDTGQIGNGFIRVAVDEWGDVTAFFRFGWNRARRC